MDQPLISVIVPVYKVEDYLDECVQSIVSQTYQNLEIILVDDGSPDTCPKLCDLWADKDHRVKVIHKENGGLASARNAGIHAATGEYLGFIDSDDCIASEMYSLLLSALQNSPYKIASCEISRTPLQPLLSNSMVFSVNKETMDVIAALCAVFSGKVDVSSCVRLYHRSIFSEICFPHGEVNEDVPVIIPMFIKSGGIVQVHHPLYYYRIRQGSISTQYWMGDTKIVHKNLSKIEHQLDLYHLDSVLPAFHLYCAKEAYFMVLTIDHHYKQVPEDANVDYEIYQRIMRKHLFPYLLSRNIPIKSKVAYIMAILRILRPMLIFLRKI